MFQRSISMILAGALAVASQCSTNTPIVDGEVVGPVVTISDGYVSAFFVPTGGGRGVLFDTGGDENGAAVLAGLKAQGVAPEQVTDVFISHGHGDHVGGVPLFPGARVWAFDADAELMGLEGPPGTALTDSLTDGQVVLVEGGLEVEALAVPGHTPGNAVYLIDGILLMGDTAVARSDGSIQPPPSNFSEDPVQATEALTILANRLAPRANEVQAMVFGHTGSLGGVDALLEWQ